jgi:hypothetical protein
MKAPEQSVPPIPERTLPLTKRRYSVTARNSLFLALGVVGLLVLAPVVVASIDQVALPQLNLTKDDGLAEGDCVNPGDTITYQICFDNCCPTTQAATDDLLECYIPPVIVADLLPSEVTFVSAAGDDATYIPESHAVIWNFCGDIDHSTADGQTCLEVVVEVNADTAPGSLITNVAGITYCGALGDFHAQAVPIDENGYEWILDYVVTKDTPVCPQEPPAPQTCPTCPANQEMVAAGWFCPGAGATLSLAIMGLFLWSGRSRRR